MTTPDLDIIHPSGRCQCGGEGLCAWCESMDDSGPDPDFGPVCRLCFCSDISRCVGPEGGDCRVTPLLGICTACLDDAELWLPALRSDLLEVLRLRMDVLTQSQAVLAHAPRRLSAVLRQLP